MHISPGQPQVHWDKQLSAGPVLQDTQRGAGHRVWLGLGPLWLSAWSLPVEGAPFCPRWGCEGPGSQESTTSLHGPPSPPHIGELGMCTCAPEDISILASTSEGTV